MTKKAARAIQLDSKLSEGLYERLGVDTRALKTEIRRSVSRGIASSASWGQVAREIQNRMNIGLNRAIRIARTEGHRIQNESRYDAQVKAKQRGANVVKQWDATLDRRTRSTHQQLDGQIREIEEPYVIPSNGRRGMYPGEFGVACEDINCRCHSFQRARWALDESELQKLKERAAYFGLDKTESFAEFKEKYLKATEGLKKQGESGTLRLNLRLFAERDLAKQKSSSIKKAIASYNLRIAEHQQKIQNPEKYVDDWHTYSKMHQDGLKRHWQKEINNFQRSIGDRVAELKERGENDE